MSDKRKSGKGGHKSQENSVIWQLSVRDVTPLSRSKSTVARGKSQKSGHPPDKTASPVPAASSAVKKKSKIVARSLEKGLLPPLVESKNQHEPLASRRRERIKIEARIDLHGLTQDAAHSALSRFLAACQAKDLRLVLVITGKGLEENENPGHWAAPRSGVLRRLVPEWLRTGTLARIVGEVRTAGPRHGGEGALYVRLKKKER